MKKFLLVIILSSLTVSLWAQKRKNNAYTYSHNLKPFVELDWQSRISNYTVTSPYVKKLTEAQWNKSLVPSCFTLTKTDPRYIVEFTTSDIKVARDANGKAILVEDFISSLKFDYQATLKLKDKDGKILADRQVSLTSDNSLIPILNPILLNKLKSGNQAAIDTVISNNLVSIIQNSLNTSKSILDNNLCGYYKMDTMYVYTAKGKDFDYTELESTEELVKSAVKNLSIKKGDTLLAQSNLKKAISIWEKELTTLDISNPDARINDEIALGLNYNLATAYFFLKEYTKGLQYIKKAIKPDDSTKKVQFSNNFDFNVKNFEKVLNLYIYR